MSTQFDFEGIRFNISATVTDDNPPPPPPPPDTGDGGLLLDGVKMFYPLKDGGVEWTFEGPKSNTGRFFTESNGPPVKNGNYFTIKAHKGTLTSTGALQWTMRLHVIPKASDVKQATWKEAKDRGYLASPKDILNYEQTGFFRVRDIDKNRADAARVTHKQHGGAHTGTHDPRASCTGIQLSTVDKNRKELMEKELNHPDYDFIKVNTLFTIDPKDFENKWFGTKAISIVSPDKNSVRHELWINTDPFEVADDPESNIKNDNWRKYWEWIDNGQSTGKYKQIVNWGGQITTWRVNEYAVIDFKKISVREIDSK